jgi:hypothetical protein
MKRNNPLTDGGVFCLLVGAAAFFPPMLGRELVVLAWLGDLMQPAGLSARVVGGVLVAIGKLRDFRNSAPVVSPTDPSLGISQPASEPQSPVGPPSAS